MAGEVNAQSCPGQRPSLQRGMTCPVLHRHRRWRRPAAAIVQIPLGRWRARPGHGRLGRWRVREAGLMERRAVSPETLAAQALGEVDLVSGGLAPVINPSTNYEQQPDGSYRQDRVYTRADNPTFEHAERL